MLRYKNLFKVFALALLITPYNYAESANCLETLNSFQLASSDIEFNVFKTDFISNQVIKFKQKGLKKALNDLGIGPELKFMPIGKGSDDPENISIQNITLKNDKISTITLSAEQDAYTYYGAFVGRVKFISQLKPNSQGKLVRVEGKTRVQIWDQLSNSWTEQVGGNPLDLVNKPVLLSNLGTFTKHVIDFNLHGLKKKLNDLNVGPKLKHQPIGKGSDDPENIQIKVATLENGEIQSLLVSAEQDAYSYYGAYVGRVEFTANLIVSEDGTLKRVEGSTKATVKKE